RGGWLRLPEELWEASGLGDRVIARASGGEIVLRAAADAGPAPAPPAVPVPGPVGAPLTGPVAQPIGPAAPFIGPIARLAGVTRAFADGAQRRVVLDGFDASFPAGTLTALTGRSGSGKSTVLALLAGLDRPDVGTVLVGDLDLAGLDRAGLARWRRANAALVTQDVGLLGFLSATENVALGLVARGVPEAEAAARAEAALHEVGLAERVRQRVHRLSAGERQRVALARALAARPALLLVDEPTSRLDEANTRALGELLVAAAERGTTIVCATHERRLAELAGHEVRL
ncbi:MAG: putative transport system ATP-binding protein, partial [Solirubrobacteraceae bacterium]|nr:putative transport system ATP-binding protein [Solirubrobacteraceae bacterium]